MPTQPTTLKFVDGVCVYPKQKGVVMDNQNLLDDPWLKSLAVQAGRILAMQAGVTDQEMLLPPGVNEDEGDFKREYHEGGDAPDLTREILPGGPAPQKELEKAESAKYPSYVGANEEEPLEPVLVCGKRPSDFLKKQSRQDEEEEPLHPFGRRLT